METIQFFVPGQIWEKKVEKGVVRIKVDSSGFDWMGRRQYKITKFDVAPEGYFRDINSGVADQKVLEEIFAGFQLRNSQEYPRYFVESIPEKPSSPKFSVGSTIWSYWHQDQESYVRPFAIESVKTDHHFGPFYKCRGGYSISDREAFATRAEAEAAEKAIGEKHAKAPADKA